jgi:hypothetical protein
MVKTILLSLVWKIRHFLASHHIQKKINWSKYLYQVLWKCGFHNFDHLYVHDSQIQMMTPKLKLTYELKIIFEKEFNMTYEGDSFMCGNSHRTKWTQKWFMIIQETYLRGVLKWYNMWKYNLVFTPFKVGTKLLNDDAILKKRQTTNNINSICSNNRQLNAQ